MDYVENTFETADRVKHFLKKYGNAMITVVLIIMLLIVGAQYWSKHKANVAVQASIAYQNLLGSVAANKSIEVSALANQLMQEYSSSPYAQLAGLLAAKQAVADNKLSLAITNLQWVVTHADSQSLKAIARLRLARVMIANNQASQALTVLNDIATPEFLAQANTVKGDAYLALHQTDNAKAAYTTALASAQKNSAFYAYIQMKLYSL